MADKETKAKAEAAAAAAASSSTSEPEVEAQVKQIEALSIEGTGCPPDPPSAIHRIAPTTPPVHSPEPVAMHSPEPSSSSPVLLNIGGRKYTTTVETLTQREPDSMLGAMFSGRHTLPHQRATGMVFVDRDGKHFRHVLNWLRDGAIPVLSESEYQQLLREAEYYQLLVNRITLNCVSFSHKFRFDPTVVHKGLADCINERLGWKKIESSEAELTRKDVIKSIQAQRVRFRGVNLSGLDLSKLDLSEVDFSYACIKNTDFSCANLHKAKFGVEASSSSFRNAYLRECEFIGADLQESVLDGANLRSANLQDARLTQCSFIETDLHSAHLQTANLTGANLRGANLEAANLKGAKLSGTNLQGANLQRAYLREVDLRDTQLTGAKLGGANLLGAIR
ncbi:hypothetical protein U9M48_006174 [Paspalum notatum var. saurae]|uniref:BTB domain-containing protein n=1 Tax=Paspalum notatum var. saurae TaxID=547442 RepID=A0AAQ3PSJ1_PASNO